MSLANKLTSKNKLGIKMFITKCDTCGVDVKLKREIRYAVSCRPCYTDKAFKYQEFNPHAKGYLGNTFGSRVIEKLGKK